MRNLIAFFSIAFFSIVNFKQFSFLADPSMIVFCSLYVFSSIIHCNNSILKFSILFFFLSSINSTSLFSESKRKIFFSVKLKEQWSVSFFFFNYSNVTLTQCDVPFILSQFLYHSTFKTTNRLHIFPFNIDVCVKTIYYYKKLPSDIFYSTGKKQTN